MAKTSEPLKKPSKFNFLLKLEKHLEKKYGTIPSHDSTDKEDMNKSKVGKTKKERRIWKNLGLALATTPGVFFVGLVIIALFGALDNAITKVQSAGYWWLLLIVGYIISLVYVICEPKIRLNHERNKVVNALFLYWEEQLEKQNKLPKSGLDIEWTRENPLERIKVWAWFDPE